MNTARTSSRKPSTSDSAKPGVTGPKAKKVGAQTEARVPRPRKATAAVTETAAATPAVRKRSTAQPAPTAAATPAKKRVSLTAKTAAAPAAATKSARAPKAKSAAADLAPIAKPARSRVKAAPAVLQLDERVRDAVIARLDAMKANDMKVIDVRGKTSVCDCLVIVSGTSTRHVKSMGDEVIVTAKKHGIAPLGVEGQKDAEWMLVDLGDTVVHLMLPKTREFYGLERLWSLTEESRAHYGALA